MSNLIIDINGIDFEYSNVIYVNGLTLEKVKIKYNWLLNARIKDAIIGEDSNGLIWYFGEWFCGEWKNGTWYSGTFHNGTWENGNWYSYLLNKFDILNEKMSIVEVGNNYSIFKNGLWLNGTFNNGTFGLDVSEDWSDYTIFYDENIPNFRIQIDNVGGSLIYDNKSVSTWIDGIFKNGNIYDSIWGNGKFFNGYIKNSKWLNGYFYNGIFEGHTWYNGYFYNGDFILGNWMNGIFTKLKTDLISRFGYTSLTGSTSCNWYDGVWKNGEFYSGFIVENNTQIPSSNNEISIWYNGLWENGLWYGGHFINGTWSNGLWYNGVFGNSISSTEWVTPKYVYQPTIELDLMWSGNTINPEYNNILSYTNNTANTYYEMQYYIETYTNSNITTYLTYIQVDTNHIKLNDYLSDMSYIISTIDINNISSDRIISSIIYNDTTGINDIYFVDNNIEDIISIKINIKRPVNISAGCGSGYTYWEFDETRLIPTLSNNLALVGSTKPIFNHTGITISQTPGYINESYQGNTIIVNSGITSDGNFYLLTNKIWNNNAKDTGKVVNNQYLDSKNDIGYMPLTFHGFNFDFDYIENSATTKITGFMIKLDVNVDDDNCTVGSFNNLKISAPLKNLFFSQFDNNNNLIYDTWDNYNYSDIYRSNNEYPYIIGSKNKNKTLTSKSYLFGTMTDTWGISGLTEYYKSENYNSDDYDVTLLETFENNLRITIEIGLNNTISQRIKISNVKIKAFYSDTENLPIWKDGYWYKGVWSNGIFENGYFKSGLWLNGTFKDGQLGSEFDERKI